MDSYTFSIGFDYCYITGKECAFEWPNGAIKPKTKADGDGDVVGCGLVLSPANEVSIFFTGNGILMGQFFQGRKFGGECLILSRTKLLLSATIK
jgi:hypothetical protein